MTTERLTLGAADLDGVLEPVKLALARIVEAAAEGRTAEVTFTYRKQTKAPARIAGEDYVALPGIKSDTFFGTVTRVWRTKAGLFRLTVVTAARSDGEQDGWLTVIPKGITGMVVTRINAPLPAPEAGAAG